MRYTRHIAVFFLNIVLYIFGLYFLSVMWLTSAALMVTFYSPDWEELVRTIINVLDPRRALWYNLYALPILGLMSILPYSIFFLSALTWLRNKGTKIWYKFYSVMVILISIPFIIWFVEVSDGSYSLQAGIAAVVGHLIFVFCFIPIYKWYKRRMAANITL